MDNIEKKIDSTNTKLDKLINILTKSKPRLNTDVLAIKTSTPNNPQDPDRIANTVTGTNGYDIINVYTELGRKSENLTLINEGTSDLFVISSKDGSSWTTKESMIRSNDSYTFQEIWELRIRSATAGNLTGLLPTGGCYRVTENIISTISQTKKRPVDSVFNRTFTTIVSANGIVVHAVVNSSFHILYMDVTVFNQIGAVFQNVTKSLSNDILCDINTQINTFAGQVLPPNPYVQFGVLATIGGISVPITEIFLPGVGIIGNVTIGGIYD